MSLADLKTLEQALSALTDDQKLEMIETLKRSLQRNGKPDVKQQRAAVLALRQELAPLPSRNPADGFSNRDHDRLLYGGKA